MALKIIAFVTFPSQPRVGRAPVTMNSRNHRSERKSPRTLPENKVLFPTECDLLLSALEPLLNLTDVHIRVYDLSTTRGRFHGLLNSVPEAPAVIINGERIIGWKAAQLALSQFQEQAF
jgi:hypothetical protein